MILSQYLSHNILLRYVEYYDIIYCNFLLFSSVNHFPKVTLGQHCLFNPIG